MTLTILVSVAVTAVVSLPLGVALGRAMARSTAREEGRCPICLAPTDGYGRGKPQPVDDAADEVVA